MAAIPIRFRDLADAHELRTLGLIGPIEMTLSNRHPWFDLMAASLRTDGRAAKARLHLTMTLGRTAQRLVLIEIPEQSWVLDASVIRTIWQPHGQPWTLAPGETVSEEPIVDPGCADCR